MLAYHKPVTLPRPPPNGAASQPLLHLGLALIEAGEHVLATAKSILHSVANAKPQVSRVPLFTEPRARWDSPYDGEWAWPRTTGEHLGRPPCEAIVDSDW